MQKDALAPKMHTLRTTNPQAPKPWGSLGPRSANHTRCIVNTMLHCQDPNQCNPASIQSSQQLQSSLDTIQPTNAIQPHNRHANKTTHALPGVSTLSYAQSSSFFCHTLANNHTKQGGVTTHTTRPHAPQRPYFSANKTTCPAAAEQNNTFKCLPRTKLSGVGNNPACIPHARQP